MQPTSERFDNHNKAVLVKLKVVFGIADLGV
jgi:hypothetical protein